MQDANLRLKKKGAHQDPCQSLFHFKYPSSSATTTGHTFLCFSLSLGIKLHAQLQQTPLEPPPGSELSIPNILLLQSVWPVKFPVVG